MSENRQKDSFIDEGLDNCVQSGGIRNWGPGLFIFFEVIGVGILAFDNRQLYGFGVGAISVGFIVFFVTLIDRLRGKQTRDFLFDNHIYRD